MAAPGDGDGAVCGSPYPHDRMLPLLPTCPAPQGQEGFGRREMKWEVPFSGWEGPLLGLMKPIP